MNNDTLKRLGYDDATCCNSFKKEFTNNIYYILGYDEGLNNKLDRINDEIEEFNEIKKKVTDKIMYKLYKNK